MDGKELEYELNLASIKAIIETTKEHKRFLQDQEEKDAVANMLLYWEGQERQFTELLYQYRLKKEENGGVSVHTPQEPSVPPVGRN